MIKGVNKQIVEINYTRDDYIEKAILIINPEKSKQPRELITQKAGNYMQQVLDALPEPPRAMQHAKRATARRLRLRLGLGLAVAALALVLVLVLLL